MYNKKEYAKRGNTSLDDLKRCVYPLIPLHYLTSRVKIWAVKLMLNGKFRHLYIHRLVLPTAWLGSEKTLWLGPTESFRPVATTRRGRWSKSELSSSVGQR